jgi:hypothetical protein
MRVSLRVLFICVTVLALVLAIAANKYRVRHAALAIIARSDGVVHFNEADSQSIVPLELSGTVRRIEFRGKQLDEDAIWAISQLHEVKDVAIVDASVGTRECKALSKLPSLSEVSFFETKIGDGAIEEIVKCPQLTTICLSFSNVTDADCRRLTSCTSLKRVALNGTEVTDSGLDSIAELPSLSVVFISEGPISAQGVETLLSRRPLSALYCFGDNFGDEWWARIRKQYHQCKIHR